MKAIHVSNGQTTFEFIPDITNSARHGTWFVITIDSPENWLVRLVKNRRDPDCMELVVAALKSFSSRFGLLVDDNVQPVSIIDNSTPYIDTDEQGQRRLKFRLKKGNVAIAFLVQDDAMTTENITWFRDNWIDCENRLNKIVAGIVHADEILAHMGKLLGYEEEPLPLNDTLLRLLATWPAESKLKLRRMDDESIHVFAAPLSEPDSLSHIATLTSYTEQGIYVDLTLANPPVKGTMSAPNPESLCDFIREGLTYAKLTDFDL